ncbi:MAG: haloacid dehalogenase-like hydrolase, partial [Kitasatospora sp.]|nr:haloacid dehalogenase-like hydrolase [Kitasatospora sp.]
MRNVRRLAALSLATLTLAGTLAAAAPSDGRAARCPQLSTRLPWFGDNRERLQRMIDERGICSRPGPGRGRPVAAFDWDNTVTKNDVTDATLAWALHHDKILRPARWRDTSKWLTPAADRALTEACGTGVRAGRPRPTATRTACADEIFEIREKERTTTGEAAFAGEW